MGRVGDRAVERHQTDIQRGRFARACGIVAFVICALAASILIHLHLGDDALGAEMPGVSSRTSFVHEIWEQLSSGESLEETMDGLGVERFDRDRAPDWFEEEMVSGIYLQDAYADAGISLVGLVLLPEHGTSSRSLIAELEEKGWARCAGGSEGFHTFIKGKGVCRWMMVTFADVGESTSAVLHIRHV